MPDREHPIINSGADREQPMTKPSETRTDLPLLPGGNNGNDLDAMEPDPVSKIGRLLDDAFDELPEPRIEVLDTEAVLDWIEAATRRLQFRRDRQHLLREAMRVLGEDFRTAMASVRLREQLDRLQERLSAKAAGTYWCERDGHRVSKLATHLLVDRQAWGRARVDAISEQSSVGVIVGRLVAAEVRLPVRRDWQQDAARTNDDEIRLFARLAVSREAYGRARLTAAAHGVTIERFLGVLVEDAYP